MNVQYDYWQKGEEYSFITHYFTQNLNCIFLMFGLLLLSVQEVEKDLQIKSDLLNETMRSVEEFLSDRGDSLSSEERAKLQGALSQMKEQHSSLTKSIHSSLAQVDTAIVTTQQQNTQRVSCPHMYMYIYFFSICQHVFFFFYSLSCFASVQGESRGADAGDTGKNRHTAQRIVIIGRLKEEVTWQHRH